MYKFVYQLNEIKKILIQFRLIEVALDLIIIFLIDFFIFRYLGAESGWIIYVLTVLYLAIALKYKFNKFNKKIVGIIEEHYPPLRERLSAAYDNKDNENVVVEDLATAVLNDMEKVKYSSFISLKRLGIRIGFLLVLLTMVLSTSIINSSVPLENKSTGVPESKPDILKSVSDIDFFNEPSFVRIGNETEGLIVYRGPGGELNVRGEKKPVPEYSGLFPEEESSAFSPAYGEAIPVVYQQIVKNYFTNLSAQE